MGCGGQHAGGLYFLVCTFTDVVRHAGNAAKTSRRPLKQLCCALTVSFVVLSCLFVVWCRRFLTLPQPPGCSTISVSRLSFRVRNGYRAFPCCYRPPTNTQGILWLLWCCVRYCVVDAGDSVITCLNLCLLLTHSKRECVCLFWSISTSSLHTLRCVQVWPINPIVCGGPQVKPHLKTGFPLRCFQRLSLPYVANQRCSWRNNWHTRGTSVPVLSY